MPARRGPSLRRLVAGWLHRLADTVTPRQPESPAAQPVPDQQAGTGGPPEHWLALVRERAPHYLEGRFPDDQLSQPAAPAPPRAPASAPRPNRGPMDWLRRRHRRYEASTPPAPAHTLAPDRSAERPPAPDRPSRPAPDREPPVAPRRRADRSGDTRAAAAPTPRAARQDEDAGSANPVRSASRRVRDLVRWPVGRPRRQPPDAPVEQRPAIRPARRKAAGEPVAADRPTAQRPDDRPAGPAQPRRHAAEPSPAGTGGSPPRPTRVPEQPAGANGRRTAPPPDGHGGSRPPCARTTELAPELALVPASGPWPELPDDSPLWIPPPPAFRADQVRRLDTEQRGW